MKLTIQDVIDVIDSDITIASDTTKKKKMVYNSFVIGYMIYHNNKPIWPEYNKSMGEAVKRYNQI